MAADYLEVDIEELTVGEINQLEELTGTAIDELMGAGKPKGPMLQALGVVLMRRDNPDYTWEQAADLRVRLSDNEDPTEAAA